LVEMCLPCHARTQSCQVELRTQKRRESFSRRDAPARRRTPVFSRVPLGPARSAPRPTCLISFPIAVRRLCCAHAAIRIPRVRRRKTARGSIGGDRERWEQKKYSQPGFRQHADRSRCRVGSDSTPAPLFPGTTWQLSHPCVRTRCKLRVKSLTLALSTRILPQVRPR